MAGRLHQGSATCGTSAKYSQRDCGSLLFYPNTLAASFSSCAHLHTQIWFFQAQSREPRRHKTTEWLISGSVTVCLYFPRLWFPVWKFKIFWHVSMKISLLPTHGQSQTSCQKTRSFNLAYFGMEEGTEACQLLAVEREGGDLCGSE